MTYTVLEKNLISSDVIQRNTYEPSTQSLFPASLETTNGKETYKVFLVTYEKNSENGQAQEISREELEPEIVYFMDRVEGIPSIYKELSKTNAEYDEAVKAGFSVSLDDYLAKRDYT